MKFGNFENLRKNAKNLTKAVMFTAAGLGAGSAIGQNAEVPIGRAAFYDRLQEVGVLKDNQITKEEFAKLSKDEIDQFALKYKEVTKAYAPGEINGKTISKTRYTIKENDKVIENPLASKKVASYSEWFASQELGTTAVWKKEDGGDGKSYKIEIDPLGKVASKNITESSTGYYPSEDDDAMASVTVEPGESIDLKDRKYDK